MTNMGYCRFRNTLEDLEDCYDNMVEPAEDGLRLSKEESKAKERLVDLCGAIASEYGGYHAHDNDPEPEE